MSNDKHETRTVREVIGGARSFSTYGYAREVIAEYENGERRREIEIEQDGEYVPKFREIHDDDR